MKRVDLHGLVALTLAVAVGASIVILAVETILHTGAISEAEATVLSTLVGAVVGAVATYLGVARSSGPPPPEAKPGEQDYRSEA